MSCECSHYLEKQQKTTHINLMFSLKLEFSKMKSEVLILKAHISFSIINVA